ncbi:MULTISPECIES: lipopolysaccharide biosynthesis protein [unclassified Streptomyces]|uniref:lipopolysaccharide biosynthesis protein n=1 Tax=unclassified Streptomyces TaxID=2593676 RepID=UPI001CB6F159|nr:MULTISPECIES: lipopolysaccharide biosynthesis protein [unclassified Streptomyces]
MKNTRPVKGSRAKKSTPFRVSLPPGRWAVLPAAVLAGAVLGGGYGAFRTPQYAATSYVIVVPAERSDPASAVGFAQAYGRVAVDIAVSGDAPVWAGVGTDTLRRSVRAETSPDAPMISLTARSEKPAKAVALADGVARALVLNSAHVVESTGVKVVPFSRAAKPVAPVSPSPSLAALVGGSAGGLLAGLALLVRPRRNGGPGRNGEPRRDGDFRHDGGSQRDARAQRDGGAATAREDVAPATRGDVAPATREGVAPAVPASTAVPSPAAEHQPEAV